MAKESDSTSKQFLSCYNSAYEKVKKNCEKENEDDSDDSNDDVFSDREDDYDTEDDDEAFDDVQGQVNENQNDNNNGNTMPIYESNFQIYYDDDYNHDTEYYDYQTGHVRPIDDGDVEALVNMRNIGLTSRQRYLNQIAVRRLLRVRPIYHHATERSRQRYLRHRERFRQLVERSWHSFPNARSRFLAFYPHFLFPFFEDNRIESIVVTFSEIRYLFLTADDDDSILNYLSFVSYLYDPCY